MMVMDSPTALCFLFFSFLVFRIPFSLTSRLRFLLAPS